MKLGNIPVLGAVIPSSPTITIDRADNGTPIRYCVDAVTEQKMQRQRLIGMATGPVIMWAGWKYRKGMKGLRVWLMRSLIMSIGAGTTISNFTAYRTISKAQKET